jgi:hypothetical protein
MKAFYTLLNFTKGPIFFGADKSDFHITPLKGTEVKTYEEKHSQSPWITGQTHTSIQSAESLLLSPIPPLHTQHPAAYLR